MKVNERKDNIETLIQSPWWTVLLEKMDGMIEDRRVLLETVNPTNKEVVYDWYDILRMDIDNINSLKNLPAEILKKEAPVIQVDNSKEL